MTEFSLVEKILICCMEVVMLNSFLRTLLKSQKRYEGKKFILLMEACTVAILTVINSFDNPMVNLVSVFVMYYIYTAVVYPASPFKCIRSSICFYMLVMTSEFMAVILFSLSNLHDAKSALKNELSGLRFAMIAKMITFVMSKCIEQVHKKSQHEKVSNSIFCYLLILQGSRAGDSIAEIAAAVGTHRDTIYKEIERSGTDQRSYTADIAQTTL